MNKEDLTHPVAKLAKLAKLDLTSEEIALFSSQIGEILAYVEQLQGVKDADLVEPLTHPFPKATPFRSDEAREPSPSSKSMLDAAAEVHDHSFKVPKII